MALKTPSGARVLGDSDARCTMDGIAFYYELWCVVFLIRVGWNDSFWAVQHTILCWFCSLVYESHAKPEYFDHRRDHLKIWKDMINTRYSVTTITTHESLGSNRFFSALD
jgi:hypothetical protein